MKQKSPAPNKPFSARIFNRLAGMANRALESVSYRIHVASANSWRDSYNPLRALTIARAVSLLEEGERGAYADLQWTFRYIEMQDATLGALIERRTSAIQKLDWNIKIREDLPKGMEAIAEKQKAALQAAYENIANLSAAFEALAMASFRGYAHLEKVTDQNGAIIELAPVDQWFWVREGLYGSWTMNRDAKFGLNAGEPVPLPRFMIREVSRPINRVALIAFIRKSLSQKDWDGFVETYGIPAVFVIMPDSIPTDKEDEYLEAAEAVTSDARGVLPGGSDIKTVDNGARANNPFKDHLAYQDEQMILRGTGGLLTMLTQSGSGTLAGSAHADTFSEIAKAEAAEISEIFRKQIDADVIERATPGQRSFAYFELAANEETDTSAIIKDVVALARAGMKVDDGWVEEKTGYKLSNAGVPGVPAPIQNRTQTPVTDWKEFPRETGTLAIPRSIMPQVANSNRAAAVGFLKARGISYKRDWAKPSDLKPTQAEYSPSKVAAVRNAGAGMRSILISADNHVVDGHHQYQGALETSPNTPIPVIRLKSSIMHVLGVLLLMPSTAQEETVRNRISEDYESDDPRLDLLAIRSALATDLKPLFDAMLDAADTGDQVAFQAAMKTISDRMPEFMEADALTELFSKQLIEALTSENE